MKRTDIIQCIFLILFFVSAGCSNEVEISTPAARRTVLVYLAGDNNLTDEVWEKIDSLTIGWHNRQDNLLIYQDTRDNRGTPSLLRVVGDAVRPYTEVVREYPEDNSASSAVFGKIVRDVIHDYPAPSYGLLFFSHGTGWLPEGSYTNPRATASSLRSIANDNGREMEIADFAAAIPDHQFDFIVFEACLMAGAEVAYELRNKADYLVASSAEILSPGFTPIYPSLINHLFTHPEADLTGFAQSYYTYCNHLEGAYRSATISVIRLNQMEALAESLRPLYAIPPTTDTAINDIQCFDRSEHKRFFDLSDFAKQTAGTDTDLDFAQSLNNVVAYQAATTHFVHQPITAHGGLTVYIEQSAYPQLNAAWRATAWYQATHTKEYMNNKNKQQ